MLLSGIFGVSTFGNGRFGIYTLPDLDTLYGDTSRVPINPFVSQITATELQINWQPPIETGNLSGYRVYRLEKEYYDKPYPIGCTRNTYYIDSGLVPENYYYYMVTSLYSTGIV